MVFSNSRRGVELWSLSGWAVSGLGGRPVVVMQSYFPIHHRAGGLGGSRQEMDLYDCFTKVRKDLSPDEALLRAGSVPHDDVDPR
ncbi:hypothetical protein GCM10022223_35350 [Kineosporia mesophila]|uniref:Uncharacterized protein n=1 Tax=Kineosporia mesophila TaxID=566012 RepID=A0ABP6ZP75_9ACTN